MLYSPNAHLALFKPIKDSVFIVFFFLCSPRPSFSLFCGDICDGRTVYKIRRLKVLVYLGKVNRIILCED